MVGEDRQRLLRLVQAGGARSIPVVRRVQPDVDDRRPDRVHHVGRGVHAVRVRVQIHVLGAGA